jgi:hypothetical protein
MVLPNDILSICIVRLSEYNFLIENIYTVEFYYNKLPIYSLNGYIINQNEIPPENLFNTVTMPSLAINLLNLFDINITIDTTIFCMANLLGKPESLNNINLSTFPELEKKYIFTMLIIMNMFIQIDSTASGITSDAKEHLLDIITCVERIKSFNDEKYKEYINPIVQIDFSKFTMENKLLRSSLRYNTRYIYFKYDNKIIKEYMFYPILEIIGGNYKELKEYKKYKKYKYKYLELKKISNNLK